MKTLKKILPSLFAFAVATSNGAAAQGINIWYDGQQSLLRLDYHGNFRALSRIDRLTCDYHASGRLDSIVVKAIASPLGDPAQGMKLAGERAEAIREYITTKFNFVERSRIILHSRLIDRREARLILEEQRAMPLYGEALTLLASEGDDIRLIGKLRSLDGGRLFDDIMKSYPSSKLHATTVEFHGEGGGVWESKPLLAVKTNLLFDAASALNLELEVPIGQRWSLAGEYIFPWWVSEQGRYCIQALSGNLEARYWLGDRERRPLMTGWFAGFHVGGGYYDIQLSERGFQGEFFIAAGLSGGYAHTVNRSGSLRMEYSLGVGYLKTTYREYDPTFGLDDKWHLVRRSSGNFTWFGPTRAKVSLVWMLDYKKYVK